MHRHGTGLVELEQRGIAHPQQVLVEEGVVVRDRIQQPLLGRFQLAEPAQVVVVGRDGLLQQLPAIDRELAQLLAQQWRGSLCRPGVRPGHQLGEVVVQLQQSALLLPMAQAPHADLGGCVLPCPGGAAVVDQVRQGMALLLEQPPQLLAQAADRDGVPGALELGLDAARQLVRLPRLFGQRSLSWRRLHQRLGQRRIALGETQHQGVLALRLAPGRLGRGQRLLRLLLALAPDQRLEQLHAGTHPLDAGGRLVPLGLEQVDPRGLTQQLLVELFDLGAQRIGTGLQDPAPGLRRGRALVGGRRQLELDGDLLLLPLGLGEALPDQRRAGCLLLEPLLEVRASGVHRGEIGLLLLKQLLDLPQAGRWVEVQAVFRGRSVCHVLRLAQRLHLGGGGLCRPPEVLRPLGVRARRLQVAQRLAVELHQLRFRLFLNARGGLDLGDLGLQGLLRDGTGGSGRGRRLLAQGGLGRQQQYQGDDGP